MGNGCSCGCGSTMQIGEGLDAGGCGCGPSEATGPPRSREEEIEELVVTWHDIQQRLAELREKV